MESNILVSNLDILLGIGYSSFLLSSQIKNWTNISNYYVKIVYKNHIYGWFSWLQVQILKDMQNLKGEGLEQQCYV